MFWCDLQVAVALREIVAFAMVQSGYLVRLAKE